LKIIISKRALNVIDAISDFVESKNTPGSGARYALKFKAAIEKLAVPDVEYALCPHPLLAAYKFSCSYFNDWVIAFRIQNSELIIHDIIHGSLLF